MTTLHHVQYKRTRDQSLPSDPLEKRGKEKKVKMNQDTQDPGVLKIREEAEATCRLSSTLDTESSGGVPL